MNTTTRLEHMALVPVEHFPVGGQAYGEPLSGAASGVAPLGQAPPPGRVLSQGESAAGGVATTVVRIGFTWKFQSFLSAHNSHFVR